QECTKSQKNTWNQLIIVMSFRETASWQALRFWTERFITAKAPLKDSNTNGSNNPSTVHETSKSLTDSRRYANPRASISGPLIPVGSCIVLGKSSISQWMKLLVAMASQ